MSMFNGWNVYKCGSCGSRFSQRAQISGNTFGARYRSDTYVDTPMGFPFVCVGKCTKCGKYFSIVGESPEWTSDPVGDELKSEESFVDLSAALDQFRTDGVLSSSLELVVRLKMLHAGNGIDGCEVVPRDKVDDNLRALANLDGASNYVKSECFRELGDFANAKLLAAKVSSDDGWYEAVPMLEAAIAEGRREPYWLQ